MNDWQRMTDWQSWHRAYDDAESSLTRRLRIVRQRVAEVVARGAVQRVLSLCAGDGRDLIPVLAGLPVERRPQTVLVELDPTLAAAARRHAAELDVTISVVTGDAGRTSTWQENTPVDLLLLCGIFGNVSSDDVRTTIRCIPRLLLPGGVVIWTRGHRDGPDARPDIRRWFSESGLDEVAFDFEPIGFGVGVNHRSSTTLSAQPIPDRLFTFIR